MKWSALMVLVSTKEVLDVAEPLLLGLVLLLHWAPGSAMGAFVSTSWVLAARWCLALLSASRRIRRTPAGKRTLAGPLAVVQHALGLRRRQRVRSHVHPAALLCEALESVLGPLQRYRV